MLTPMTVKVLRTDPAAQLPSYAHPGDAAAIVRSQVKEDMSRRTFGEAVQSWGEANMARLGVQPADWTSMKEQKDDDDGDADDGEVSQD